MILHHLKLKIKALPWIREHIKAPKRECTKPESKSKANRLQIWYKTMTEQMMEHQKGVKNATAAAFFRV